jgi:hypothetical protein
LGTKCLILPTSFYKTLTKDSLKNTKNLDLEGAENFVSILTDFSVYQEINFILLPVYHKIEDFFTLARISLTEKKIEVLTIFSEIEDNIFIENIFTNLKTFIRHIEFSHAK